jgi:hypothetical protein
MDDISAKLDELVKNLKEYADIQYQLAVLKAGNIISSVTAKILAAFIIAFIFLLFVIIISVTAGFYLSTLMGSLTKGFLLLAGIYFVVGLVLLIFRNKLIVGPIRNILIKHIYADEN